MAIKNKKGMGLEWYLLIVAIALGLIAYVVDFYFAPHKIIDNYIGQHQFSILKADHQAEKAAFYIGQSAKYALQQVVYEIGQNGGISDVIIYEAPSSEYEYGPPSYNKCGKFYGYSIWYLDKELQNNKLCVGDTQIKVSLDYAFNKNMNSYLQKYPADIPLNNYDHDFTGNLEVKGNAKSLAAFSIVKDETKPVINEPERITMPAMAGNFKDFTGTSLCAKGEKCILTEESFSKLEKAHQRAKEKGISIEVYSGYRTEGQQMALWEGRTAEKYAQRFPDAKERAKWVCNPDGGADLCPHMSGNAADVRFKGKTTETTTREEFILLHKIMTNDNTEDRWVGYTKEPWHFECCGTKRFARAKELGVTEVS
ncbi:D-alanyl-D-alanine carboxypeptidase family protein [Candidatus Woesearchaeota archaeon]|nr:D-alanyl-D-alanine carboxypeptidase family protein [Candidatus Woesearchaeota archaeon]